MQITGLDNVDSIKILPKRKKKTKDNIKFDLINLILVQTEQNYSYVLNSIFNIS